MNVLSLFDGMSAGQMALKKIGIEVDNYYASEIEIAPMNVTRYNFPKTKFIGDVRFIDLDKLPKIDLLIGGSPCQSFSFAGKMKGAVTKDNIEITNLDQYLQLKKDGFEFEGQSYLFWEYIYVLRYLKKKNPNLKFLLENVKMIDKWKKVFNEAVGIEPILINSALVSAQNRERYYWTNIEKVEQPIDKNILLRDIIEEDNINYFEKDFFIKDNITLSKNGLIHIANIDMKGNDSLKRVYSINGKSPTLTTMQGGHREPKILLVKGAAQRGRYIGDKIEQLLEIRKDDKSNCITTIDKNSYLAVLLNDDVLKIRKLTSLEFERLQTFSDNYSLIGLDENNKEIYISKSARNKMLGNSWTVDVISHIFFHMDFSQL